MLGSLGSMAFTLIRAGSLPLIDAARAGEGAPVVADRAAAELRADFERWSRWTLGFVAFLLAVGGSFFGFGLLSTVLMLGGFPVGLDLAIVLVATAAALGGSVLLVRLWWTGRRLVTAAAWWLRLPYTSGGRMRRPEGWLQARLINFEPPIFARLVTATLSCLIAIGTAALVIRDVVEGATSLTAAAALVTVISGLSGLGQAGGVIRLVAGVSEGDPLWVRVRSFVLGRSPRSTQGRR